MYLIHIQILLLIYNTMATMTCVVSNPLYTNVHVTGIIQECFGLEPSEINHIIEAHRNNNERQRRYQQNLRRTSQAET